MNMIDVQDKLKGLSEQQLVQEMQSPSGVAPQFLVLSEITRRKRMRDSFKSQQAQPKTTIAEEAVASAGVPNSGLSSMARALAPNSSMAQNTAAMPVQPMPEDEPVQRMYGGGMVRRMAAGGAADLSNPMMAAWVQREAQRRGVTVEEVLASLGPTGNALSQASQSMDRRNRMLGLEPPVRSPDPNFSFPTQSDLDRRFAEGNVSINSTPMQPQPIDSLPEIFPAAPREGRVIGRPPMSPIQTQQSPMLPPVDLDLTAPEPMTPVAPRPESMRLMGLEPQGGSSPRVDEILDQRQYGYTPGSDRRMSATELLSQSAGPQPALPAAPASPSAPAADEPTSRLSIDPYTGMVMNAPTIGQQMKNAGQSVSDAAGYVADSLPALDMSSGDPYSELTSEEMDALTSGRMSPETANALQSGRLAMARYSRGSEEVNLPAPQDGSAPVPPAAPAAAPSPASGNVPSSASVSGGGTSTTGGVGGAGRGAGAAVGGAGAPTSYEQELRDAMARAEKRATQDKWLALAQVGLQLMASKEPTLGGALGEAGLAGLQSFRGSRDAYEQERLGLSKAMFDIDQQRQRAMAVQKAAGAKASSAPTLKEIDDAINSLTTEAKGFDDQGNEINKRVPAYDKDAALVDQLLAQRAAMIAGRFAPTM